LLRFGLLINPNFYLKGEETEKEDELPEQIEQKQVIEE
jgi:hypothetical protein